MSTRATYTIESKTWNDKTEARHFYIHYDGYPEGAAEYFKATANIDNKRGGLACQFLRTNDLAEFTSHPDHHGDTEYHYTLRSDMTVTAYKIDRDWKDDKGTTKKVFFVGLISDFINKYQNRDEPQPDYFTFKGQIMTKSKLEYKYSAAIKEGLQTFALGHVGNAGSYLHDAIDLFRFLNPNEDLPKEILFFAELERVAYDHKCTTQEYIARIYDGADKKGVAA